MIAMNHQMNLLMLVLTTFNQVISMRFFYILLFISVGVYAQNPKYDLDYYFSEFETPNSSIPTPKEIITIAEEKTGYSVSKEFIKIPKHRFKKGWENGF